MRAGYRSMALAIRTARVSDTAAWQTFAEGHPGATICHLPHWTRIVPDRLGHTSHSLIATESDTVVGVLPLYLVTSWWGTRRLVSIPWLDYGGVIAETEQVAAALLSEAERLRAELKADAVEMRTVNAHAVATKHRTDKVTFRLDLSPGGEAIWKDFNAKLRNQVRKADKSELTTSFGRHDYLDEFYTVFCRNMRDLGTPVWGRDLFAAVLDEFADSAEIVLVKHEKRTVAGGLLLKWNGQWYVPSASSYREVRSMCPNHALYWSTIERAAREGAKWFDFGRSTWDGPTFRFKKQWVPDPTPMTWQYLLPQGEEVPVVSPGNPKYKLMIAAWQRLPLPVANWLGPKVIRNFP